jgi:hypothetical protein
MVDEENRQEILDIIKSIKSRRDSFHSVACQSEEEFILLAEMVKKCNHLHGDFAEIGVYEGFTSEFISKFMHKDKVFFLCDTFSGLADVSVDDPNINMSNGALAVDEERFNSINPFCKNIKSIIVPGYFPDSSTKEMNSSRYAFVHIDTDTYISTLKSLEYFYPKMVNGGIIVVHDYRNHNGTLGVKKAVDSFMIDKEDALSTRGGTTQGIITKI